MFHKKITPNTLMNLLCYDSKNHDWWGFHWNEGSGSSHQPPLQTIADWTHFLSYLNSKNYFPNSVNVDDLWTFKQQMGKNIFCV